MIRHVEAGVGWLKLNRPKALNALSVEMVDSLYEILDTWRADSNVSLIMISGEGTKGLCAGGDIRFLYEQRNNQVEKHAEHFFTTEYRLDWMIHQYPKPILVYMDGIVMGGGVGLSVGASERIVTEKTKWAMPEMNIGFFPDVGASYFLNRMPGHIGRYLALTAETINAADALYVGAADRYMESSQWETFINEVQNKNWSLQNTKKQLTELLDSICTPQPLDSSLSEWQSKIDKHFAFDTVEEMIQSLGLAANAGDEWSLKTKKIIEAKSPTSLKVTLSQMQRGESQSLLSCFNMELALSMNFMKNHDFYEGVRSVLVDKDRNPQWDPKTFAEVSPEDVESYFHHTINDSHPIK
ncbi:enoyl-CoA hydratase/isomerase family protein [Niallia sp. Krafla_26]|uniref:enoyl-CoA hydratase/isomerase family protein n=1 Tax=Niallia sp. Krafla_26 TaxID=3064703 RepID=UPI003D164161